jgi:comEA protein
MKTLNQRILAAAGFLMLLSGGTMVDFAAQSLFAAPKAEMQIETQAKVVNINKAGVEELQTLRGIGPAIASRIIQYRESHGNFEKIEDLVNVGGIGQAKLQKIKTQVTV